MTLLHSQGLCDWPSPSQPAKKCGAIYAKLSTPLRDSLRSALKNKQSIAAPVVGLLSDCRPTAIVWRISQRIIYPLQGEALEIRRPHVLQKFGEVIPPPINGYAPPAIVWIILILRVETATPHAAPDRVESWLLAEPVSGLSADRTFSLEAPARCGVTRLKFVCCSGRGSPAVACTFPLPRFATRQRDNCQPTEPQPHQFRRHATRQRCSRRSRYWSMMRRTSSPIVMPMRSASSLRKASCCSLRTIDRRGLAMCGRLAAIGVHGNG